LVVCFFFAELNAAPAFSELNAARIETVCVGSDEGLWRLLASFAIDSLFLAGLHVHLRARQADLPRV
jgi:hypothetical protein